MKKIIVVLIILLSIPFVSFAQELDSYRGAKWGMTVKEVEEVLKKMGLQVNERGNNMIVTDDTILGYKSKIGYLFTPISGELYGVIVLVNSTTPYDDIKTGLIEKYGHPPVSEDRILKKDLWYLPNKLEVKLGIVLSEKIGEIKIVYSNAELAIKAKKERKKKSRKR